MKILVEGYHYPSGPAWVLLDNFKTEEFKDRKEKKTTDVGYCFDKVVGDCIFVLPKVILDTNEKIFNDYRPEQILDPSNVIGKDSEGVQQLNNEQLTFINDLCIWVYRSLAEYKRLNNGSESVLEKSFSEVGTGTETKGSYFDIIMALLKFYRENKDFVMFTMRKAHSQNHKILWNKTISRTTAIMQDGVPLYLNPISKRKEINWDEELLRIYFSILNYINKFGFKTHLDVNCELIKGALFDSYLKGMGVRKLQQIKYKYFSDKTIQLWDLCYAFFKKGEQIRSSKQNKELLVATKYDRVFEDIVDELIGEQGPNKEEYDKWKKVGDGKVLDHIYPYKSVCSNADTFYIGDSKYYQTKTEVKAKTESAQKQFSYARSIVNNIIRKTLREAPKKKNAWPYRDPLTEGYAIIPNFFICAECDPDYSFSNDGLDNEKMKVGRSFVMRQFVNRLFDRDTLWVRQYSLNFLYILALYGASNDSSKKAFREKVREFFRQKTIELLDQNYIFSILTPKDGKDLDKVMTGEVKWKLQGILQGMVYRIAENGNQLLLAIEKPHSKTDVFDDIELYDNAYDDIYTKEDIDNIKEIINSIFDKKEIDSLEEIFDFGR